jgi:thiol:disulfide interchange protein DsbD
MWAAFSLVSAAVIAAVPAIALASPTDDPIAMAIASSGVAVGQTLSPDQAFRPTVQQHGHEIELRFSIADGYHLYRDKIRIETDPPGGLSDPVFPAAEVRVDRVLGQQKVFSRDATVRLTVAEQAPIASR